LKLNSDIPFSLIDWDKVPAETHNGISGFATWRILKLGEIRVRLVEYSPNYYSDHWCDKGHIIYCIEGEMTTELRDGQKMKMTKGMTYIVGDDSDSHRSFSEKGVKLFIVD
jgi:quercetin dioxygenase-like cupin family protein